MFIERLMTGIAQMKQVISTKVTNPQNNADWTAHVTEVINNATGMCLHLLLLFVKKLLEDSRI